MPSTKSGYTPTRYSDLFLLSVLSPSRRSRIPSVTRETTMRVDIDRLIDRWEHGLAVLQKLTPHERRHHFKMATWGEKTDCGTVACAAGMFSLDPWFRKRRFSSVWREGEWPRLKPVLDPVGSESWMSMIEKFFYVNWRLSDMEAEDF